MDRFESPIHAAARLHNGRRFATLRVLLSLGGDEGLDLEARDNDGRTAVHIAAGVLDEACFDALVPCGEGLRLLLQVKRVIITIYGHLCYS